MKIELLTTRADAKIGWFMVDGVEYGISLSRTLYDADGNKLGNCPETDHPVIDVMIKKFKSLTGRVYY